jgi:hypothetical protein
VSIRGIGVAAEIDHHGAGQNQYVVLAVGNVKTTQIAKASAKNGKDDGVIPTAGPIKALSPPSLGGK